MKIDINFEDNSFQFFVNNKTVSNCFIQVLCVDEVGRDGQ